jgi:hypothetical protein
VVYLLAFSSSIVLLISVSLSTSFPLLTQYTNGTSGLGEFGSLDSNLWVQSLQFAQFVEDKTKVIEIEPTCSDPGCASYILSGGLKAVNISWNHLRSRELPSTISIIPFLLFEWVRITLRQS